MAERWFLDNEHKIDSFLTHVRQKIADGEPCTVEFCNPSRSDRQNALFHALISEIAKQKKDESTEEIKRYVKLRFGVPILRSQSDGFRAMYDKAIKGSLTYEEKLEAMEFLPVTSQMDKNQMTELIDAIAKHYSEQGFDLTHLPAI